MTPPVLAVTGWEGLGVCLLAALSLCGLCRPHRLVQAASPVWAQGQAGF